MVQDKETKLDLLKWYHNQGIDEVISDNIRTYKKKENKIPAETKTINNLITTAKEKPLAKYLPPHSATNLARKLANESSSLGILKKAIENFEGCNLKKTAMNTVFSDGQASSDVMLIGEAPGANEDLEGIPFCGQSGKLLDAVLKSIDLDRKKNLYITNSIFWRPPGNRKPTAEELECCRPFLEKHISIINPKLIILAGSVAAHALFDHMGIHIGAISKERQKIFKYTNQYLKHEIATVVIYHPSYLLRQPSQKKVAWHDMLFIKNILDNI